ncbi:MAG: CRISPR-associated helicase Cas3' [Candidatus Omnitrophota bacterium]
MLGYYWAKTSVDGNPGKSVLSHMRDVQAVANIVLRDKEHLLSRYNLNRKIVSAFAGLHDIGKASPGFQAKCVEWLRKNGLEKIARNNAWDTLESDHAKISQFTVQNMLKKENMVTESAEIWAALLGAHHGRLNRPGITPKGCKIDDEWEDNREKLAQEFLDTVPLPNFVINNSWPLAWWMAGLVSVSDWIASNEDYFSPEQIEINIAESAAKAREAVSAIGFEAINVRKGLSFSDIFIDKRGRSFQPNDLQLKAGMKIVEPGLYVIEAPMGMGKTEAALWSAYKLMCVGKATGIYFSLPTQTTSNRMYTRMQDFLDKTSLMPVSTRLIHANSWLFDKVSVPAIRPAFLGEAESAQEAKDWFASKKRALLASFGVGTIDQALMSIIAVKHFFVRQFALAGKVIILDEVHSYDLYTGMLIKALCDRLLPLGCTIIVLSATLISDTKKRFVDVTEEKNEIYPVITGKVYVSGEQLQTSVERPEEKNIHISFKDADKSMVDAIRKAKSGACVLWVCDTVNRAQEMYQNAKGKVNGYLEIGLLHSRFPLFRRQELEDYWMEKLGKDSENRNGCILFSTQVVEQSVDLDADFMVSELAPTDMLFQRMGRLWRHNRLQRPCERPEFYILSEKKDLAEFKNASADKIKKMFGNKARVYAAYVLLRSLEFWRTRDGQSLKLPDDIRGFLIKTYEDRDDDPEDWQKLSDEIAGEQAALKMAADFETNVWNLLLNDDEGAAKTRINSYPTTQLILVKQKHARTLTLLTGENVELGKEHNLIAARALYRNIVKVPSYCFASRPDNKDILILVPGDWQLGVMGIDDEIACKRLKEGYRLKYTAENGLEIINDMQKGEVDDEPCD